MIARCGRRLLLRVALLLAVGLLLLFRTSLPQAPHRIRGWASPVARERQRPHNLLLITLDTMRADRLPAYGFDAVETPTLDRLATGGVVFEETFAAVPLTMPSHATLFTGLYPPKLSVRDNADAPLLPHFESLAELLRDRGLTTGAFIASGVLTRSRGLDQGFAVYDDELPPSCSGRGRARRSANEVVDHALSWFARAAPEPFFVWIHFYDTHRPYELPSEFSRRYQDPYLAAIAFEDAQIARVIHYLESRNLAKDTLVVIAGDHGESLGDHGEETHGLFVYQEALHVPLIMAGPGIVPGRVRDVTRLVDVMPTVLALFGVQRPSLDGVSLAEVVSGSAVHVDTQREVYAESLYPRRFGWAQLRSLRSGRYKVIDAPRPELYDLLVDSREQHDLFEERRALGTVLLDRLHKFDEDRSAVAAARPAIDGDLAERVAALGYVSGAVPRQRGNSTDAADPKDRVAEFNHTTARRINCVR